MQTNFIPSEYQKEIFKFFSEGVGNVVINAKAGSSKTTTAIRALDYIPVDKSVLFLAFNKSIADELSQRIGDKKNVRARTFHSLGYSIVHSAYPNAELNQHKYKEYILRNLAEISDGQIANLSKEERERYRRNCVERTDLSRYNKAQSEREIGEVAERYGIVCEANEVYGVKKILEWGKTNLETIDYTDMEWLPYELGLENREKYDWVIIDEAQDTSPVRQELFKKCLKKGTRFAAIGDRDQTINTWCGSDARAFDNFLKESNTIQLDLPICYRCPKAVIKKLQTLVPDIQAKPDAIEGEVRYDVSQFEAKPGDMVLCRNSAPLSVLYSDYIQKNEKAYIKGSDVGDGLVKMIDSTKSDTLAFDFSSDGVIPILYKGLLKTLKKIMQTDGVSLENAIENEGFTRQYDAIKTIEILGNGTKDSEYLISRIKKIFTKTDQEGICLSTVHKAKGLEADNVFIILPSLMPSPLARKDWEIEAEHNIQYVAWSRARKTLNFVSEKLFPPERCFSDSRSILADIKDIDEKLNNIYGKYILSDIKYPEGVGNYTRTDVKKPKATRAIQPKKDKIGGNKFKNFLK